MENALNTPLHRLLEGKKEKYIRLVAKLVSYAMKRGRQFLIGKSGQGYRRGINVHSCDPCMPQRCNKVTHCMYTVLIVMF